MIQIFFLNHLKLVQNLYKQKQISAKLNSFWTWDKQFLVKPLNSLWSLVEVAVFAEPLQCHEYACPGVW